MSSLPDFALPVLLAVVLGVIFVIFFFGRMKSGSKASENSEKSLDMSPSLKREWQNTSTTALNALDSEERVLNPVKFKAFSVLLVKKISHNTKLIRLEIPFGQALNLPIGRHLTIKADIGEQKVMRAYTPASRPDQHGYFDLLVKRYEFGKMSTHMHSLRAGSSIEVRGPIGRFKYTKNQHPKMGLIAGGTGLTPCLQVIRSILQSPEYAPGDKTRLTFFFQNRTEEDILLLDELELLVKKFSQQLTVVNFLSNPTEPSFGVGTSVESIRQRISSGSLTAPAEMRGYVSQEAVDTLLGGTDECPLVCLCGPSGFNEAMKKLLVQAGHREETDGALQPSIYVW